MLVRLRAWPAGARMQDHTIARKSRHAYLTLTDAARPCDTRAHLARRPAEPCQPCRRPADTDHSLHEGRWVSLFRNHPFTARFFRLLDPARRLAT